VTGSDMVAPHPFGEIAEVVRSGRWKNLNFASGDDILCLHFRASLEGVEGIAAGCWMPPSRRHFSFSS
jgi:hypothetical protein